MFKVIRQTTENANTYTPTLHTQERRERYETVARLGGTPVVSCVVDTAHPNGLEIHTVLDSGVVVIGNATTKRLITWLIARPAQLIRYGVTDKAILDKAYANYQKGLNN